MSSGSPLAPLICTSYTPGEVVTNGRSDHISVKINGKPSLVQDQASARKMLLVN